MTFRSSASPAWRAGCRPFCAASGKPRMPSPPRGPTPWSSSTAPISPIASRAECGGGRRRIPILDYVSPTVWAWRPWRARAMRAYVDCVLAHPAVRAGRRIVRLDGPPCALCRPSAGRAARRTASERRGGAAPAFRSAPCSGPARQPVERDRKPAGHLWRRGRAARGPDRADGACIADRAAPCLARAAGGCRLAGRSARRRRACGEVGRVPRRARGACCIRHGHARTRACRSADGRRLQGLAPRRDRHAVALGRSKPT